MGPDSVSSQLLLEKSLFFLPYCFPVLREPLGRRGEFLGCRLISQDHHSNVVIYFKMQRWGEEVQVKQLKSKNERFMLFRFQNLAIAQLPEGDRGFPALC